MPLPLTDADFAAEMTEEARRLNQMCADAAALGVQIDTEEGDPEVLDEDGALTGTRPTVDPDMFDDDDDFDTADTDTDTDDE